MGSGGAGTGMAFFLPGAGKGVAAHNAVGIQLQKEMEDPATAYDNYYLNAGGWDGV